MALREGEFLSQNLQRAYPFADGEYAFDNSGGPSGGERFNSAIVDALITYAPTVDLDAPLCLASVNLNLHTLTIRTADSALVYNLTNSHLIADTVSGDGDYRTVQWGSDALKIGVVLVFNRAHPKFTVAANPTFTVTGTLPPFVPRVCEKSPQRVNSIALVEGLVQLDINETGELLEGYNIKIEVDPDTPQVQTLEQREASYRPGTRRIVISAIPGAGLGRVPADCDSPGGPIYTLASVAPQNGDVRLEGDNCYRIMRPAATPGDTFESTPHQLNIANDCRACCNCDDFVTIMETIRDLKERGLLIKEMLAEARAGYAEILAEWKSRQSCLNGKGCFPRLHAYSYTGWTVMVQLVIVNPNNCAVDGAEITVTFSGGDFVTELIAGAGLVSNAQDHYAQTEPTELSANTYQLIDNTGIPAGSSKVLVFGVRFLPSADRLDSQPVIVEAVIEGCVSSPKELTATVPLRKSSIKS